MSIEIRWRQRYSNFRKALAELDEAVSKKEYSKIMKRLITLP